MKIFELENGRYVVADESNGSFSAPRKDGTSWSAQTPDALNVQTYKVRSAAAKWAASNGYEVEDGTYRLGAFGVVEI